MPRTSTTWTATHRSCRAVDEIAWSRLPFRHFHRPARAVLDLGVLSSVGSDEVDLTDFRGARQSRGGGGLHHPTSEGLGHRLCIVLVEAEFTGDLAVPQVQPHQRAPGNPDPQWVVMPHDHRSGQVVPLLLAC